MNQIKNCPICNSETFSKFLSAIDYTVSNASFNIVSCDSCGFHFTNPIPLESEIGEYYKSESYISHSSSNKGLINKLYQLVRTITLKQKVKLVQQESKGKDLLDIGAGTGHFMNACKLAGINALGLEPDADARGFSEKNFGLDMKSTDELHSLPENSRDVITMWHVLEHVYNLNTDFEKIRNILKPDGKLIIAVPNMSSYDAKHYKEFWAAYDLPIHLYHFQPKDINALAEKFNMKVEKVLPMKFDSFYVSMLSEKYKGGNILKAFWIGLKSNLKARGNKYSSQIYILSKS